MPKHHHCLNCNEPISKRFCPNCGQKTDTHRITIKHFIFHDLLHGVWHLEKGILFTLKEALIRPGQAALDYVGGKRVRYYNVFYLSLLLIGLHFLFLHFYEGFRSEELKNHVSEGSGNINDFFTKNAKSIFFSLVPVLALNGFIFFRKLNLNLAEHLIIAGIGLLVMLEITILFSFFDFLNEKIYLLHILGFVEVVSFFAILLFPLWLYFNVTKNCYSFWGRIMRLFVFYLCIILEIFLILSLIVFFITDSNSKGVYINL